MRTRRRTAGEMFPLVEQYTAGSLSAEAFCAEHGITLSQLYYWRSKYHARDDASSFVEVGPAAAGAQPWMEGGYPHGVQLRVYAAIPTAALRSLLRPRLPSVQRTGFSSTGSQPTCASASTGSAVWSVVG